MRTLRFPGPALHSCVRGTLLAGAFAAQLACGESSPAAGDAPTGPGWGAPEVLADDAVFDSLNGPCLSGNAAGDAVAVWAPSNVGLPPVLSRRFSPRGGWASVETIDRAGDSSVNTPTVRMTARGDVMAVWNTYFGLYASTRAAAGVWEDPELVRRSSSFGWTWGLDDAGRALLAWPVQSTILTTRFEPDRGWRDLGPLPGAEGVDFLGAPALVVGGGGHALAAWSSRSGGVRASWFDPEQGFGPTYFVDPAASGAGGVSVFLGAGHSAIVAWAEPDPSVAGGNVLHASLFDEVTGFSEGVTLGPTAGTVIAASLDGTGRALVVYMSGLGLRRQRHQAETGWQSPEPLEGVGGFDAVVLDDAGHGWVLWDERSATDSGVVTLRSRRLEDGRASGPVEEVAPAFSGYAWFCGTAMDAAGGLTAGWFQSRPGTGGSPESYSFVASHYRLPGGP